MTTRRAINKRNAAASNSKQPPELTTPNPTHVPRVLVPILLHHFIVLILLLLLLLLLLLQGIWARRVVVLPQLIPPSTVAAVERRVAWKNARKVVKIIAHAIATQKVGQ